MRRETALAVPPGVPAFNGPANQDRDWGLRLLKAGFRGRFDPTLRADHLYRRNVREFIRTHARSGAGTWLVHELHADLLGHLPTDHYYRHLPRLRQRVVRLAGRPRSRSAIRAAELMARVAPRVSTIETALAMAQHRAALDASRSGAL
jgi:GT2 family glycosyltransferase